MSTSAVVSFVDHVAKRERSLARKQVHDRVDEILDRLEGEMKEPDLDLEEIVAKVMKSRASLTSGITEALLSRVDGAAPGDRRAPCPRCRRVLTGRGPHARTVETMVGPVTIDRFYFYCTTCRLGFYPVDERLGLAPGRTQFDLQKAATRLTAEVPYETAQEIFKELTGLSLSTDTMHGITNEASEGLGVLDVCPTREEIDARIDAMSANRTWRPILVITMDGGMTPTRPEAARAKRPGRKHIRANRANWKGEWREAKGFRFYLVDRTRIIHLISWHQIQTDEELAAALEAVKNARLIPVERVRLCAVADGAHWIWKRVTELFPTARQILDYYHVKEKLHEFAALKYEGEETRALEWAEATMTRFYEGEVQDVVADLDRMRDLRPAVRKETELLANYLERNAERIDYRSDRKGGHPIGSGGIESAHKFIAHVRLKRSGAWWYTTNSNHMLALRCARYNGTFDRVFRRHKQQSRVRAGADIVRIS